MAKYIICGIDAHEESLFCWIGIDKDKPNTKRYANTTDGRDMLFWVLKGLSQEHGHAKVVVAYEASPLGYVLYDDCVDVGFECYILAPTKIPKATTDKKTKPGRSSSPIAGRALGTAGCDSWKDSRGAGCESTRYHLWLECVLGLSWVLS